MVSQEVFIGGPSTSPMRINEEKGKSALRAQRLAWWVRLQQSSCAKRKLEINFSGFVDTRLI